MIIYEPLSLVTVYDHAVSSHFQPPPPVPPRVTAAETVTVTGTVSMDVADVDSDLAVENKRFVFILSLCCVLLIWIKHNYDHTISIYYNKLTTLLRILYVEGYTLFVAMI